MKTMLATAQRVLGYDLLQVCLQGPRERLDDTAYAQPALFVAGLAAVERLRVQVRHTSCPIVGKSSTCDTRYGMYGQPCSDPCAAHYHQRVKLRAAGA